MDWKQWTHSSKTKEEGQTEWEGGERKRATAKRKETNYYLAPQRARPLSIVPFQITFSLSSPLQIVKKKTWQRFQSVISFPRLLIIVNKFTLENFFIFAWAWNNYHFNSKHLTTVNKQQSCLPPPGSTPMRTRCRVWSPPALIPLRTRRTASLHHTRRRRRRLHTTALIWSRHSLPERGRVC